MFNNDINGWCLSLIKQKRNKGRSLSPVLSLPKPYKGRSLKAYQLRNQTIYEHKNENLWRLIGDSKQNWNRAEKNRGRQIKLLFNIAKTKSVWWRLIEAHLGEDSYGEMKSRTLPKTMTLIMQCLWTGLWKMEPFFPKWV